MAPGLGLSVASAVRRIGKKNQVDVFESERRDIGDTAAAQMNDDAVGKLPGVLQLLQVLAQVRAGNIDAAAMIAPIVGVGNLRRMFGSPGVERRHGSSVISIGWPDRARWRQVLNRATDNAFACGIAESSSSSRRAEQGRGEPIGFRRQVGRPRQRQGFVAALLMQEGMPACQIGGGDLASGVMQKRLPSRVKTIYRPPMDEAWRNAGTKLQHRAAFGRATRASKESQNTS